MCHGELWVKDPDAPMRCRFEHISIGCVTPRNLVGPGLAAVRQTKPTPEVSSSVNRLVLHRQKAKRCQVSLNPSQERAKKRLQQRKAEPYNRLD